MDTGKDLLTKANAADSRRFGINMVSIAIGALSLSVGTWWEAMGIALLVHLGLTMASGLKVRLW